MPDDGRIGHVDDVPQQPRLVADGPLGARVRYLTRGVLTTCGARHITVEPGTASTPVHTHAWEEELFAVLSGSGVLVTLHEGATHAYRVGPGDVILHRAGEEAHTLIAGPDALDLLVVGESYPDGATTLPRTGIAWFHPGWIAIGDDRHPYAIESALGLPEHGEPEEPRRHVCAIHELPTRVVDRGPIQRVERNAGTALGARSSGLRHVRVEPGRRSTPRHCHSIEEEFFYVLSGSGAVELAGELSPLRPGSFVSCPVGPSSTHAVTAGPDGIEYLVYGTRRPGDACFYPDSAKVSMRGLGVAFRVEPLDYWDGEE